MKIIDVTTKVMDTTVTKCTCGFKEGEKKNHKGVDLVPKSTEETPNILAFDAGEVIYTGNVKGVNENTGNPGMGTSLAIKHKDGTVTRYQHLKYNSLKVKMGDTVKKGQVLGVYGRPTTGNSTGPHLHFDISLPSKPKQDSIKAQFCGETRYYIDPIPYLTKKAAQTEAKKDTAKKYIVTASALNIRNGSSLQSKIVGRTYKGVTVTVDKVENNFGRIGKDQWVCMDYLK
jgi:hypothetical protein